MIINTNQILSVSEVNQNFSKATKLADQHGSVVVLKNNQPCYILISLREQPDFQISDDEKIDIVAQRILKRHKKAFQELAK